MVNSKSDIYDVKIWFELWSKAGATPSYIVENRLEYISNFNRFLNCLDNYFFNKVSDFIIGIIFLIGVIYLVFLVNQKKIKKFKTKNTKLIYLFVFLFFLEWLFNHPTLRYGGYHIIALLFFIPASLYMVMYKITFKNFIKKFNVIFIIILIIFSFRNISRLNKEYKLYNYNPIKNPNYNFVGGDKKFHMRYNDHIKSNLNNYLTKKYFGKK